MGEHPSELRSWKRERSRSPRFSSPKPWNQAQSRLLCQTPGALRGALGPPPTSIQPRHLAISGGGVLMAARPSTRAFNMKERANAGSAAPRTRGGHPRSFLR